MEFWLSVKVLISTAPDHYLLALELIHTLCDGTDANGCLRNRVSIILHGCRDISPIGAGYQPLRANHHLLDSQRVH